MELGYIVQLFLFVAALVLSTIALTNSTKCTILENIPYLTQRQLTEESAREDAFLKFKDVIKINEQQKADIKSQNEELIMRINYCKDELADIVEKGSDDVKTDQFQMHGLVILLNQKM